MLINQPPDIRSAEITDRHTWLRRREVLAAGLRGGAGALAAGGLLPALLATPGCADAAAGGTQPLADVVPAPSGFRVDEEITAKKHATTYNNFYELGTDKGDPVRNAGKLRTRPWSVVFDGEIAKPGAVPLESILAPHALEERIYRLRCVEAWSMVIPWVGVPLASVLKRLDPTSRARHVAFETLVDPKQLPGQKRATLPWPYREGLRIDEAMHPLTLLAVGMYGETLPGQNGAPIRLVVPWKYGFKSIKSIVRITLQRDEPPTSWNDAAPQEYGFYANVNPAVDHPRWSQARERRLGEWGKRETLAFNGYADQVASLYTGMDLRKLY